MPNFRFHADDTRDPAAKDKLKEAFAAAHLKAKVEVYEGCNHGWMARGSEVFTSTFVVTGSR